MPIWIACVCIGTHLHQTLKNKGLTFINASICDYIYVYEFDMKTWSLFLSFTIHKTFSYPLCVWILICTKILENWFAIHKTIKLGLFLCYGLHIKTWSLFLISIIQKTFSFALPLCMGTHLQQNLKIRFELIWDFFSLK